MAKLTAAKRRAIPTSEYAGPNRSYAVLAKAMATRFASPAERAKIDRKANAKLGK